MERYRCSACGYFHVGPAPENCPVCGAPKTAFKEYEGPGDLTGTKTLENLKAAFAGESQANRRYTLWKRIAELEGAPAVRARGVRARRHRGDRARARPPRLHRRLRHHGGEPARRGCGRGRRGDRHVPGFAETPRSEGFPEIAFYFRSVGRFEARASRGVQGRSRGPRAGLASATARRERLPVRRSASSRSDAAGSIRLWSTAMGEPALPRRRRSLRWLYGRALARSTR